MAQLHYVIRAEEAKMANVFVEPRPKGKPEGSPITDYIVETRADHVLGAGKGSGLDRSRPPMRLRNRNDRRRGLVQRQ